MPHRVVDIEPSRIENDVESSHSSQIEGSDRKIADFCDNADISTNYSFYRRLETIRETATRIRFCVMPEVVGRKKKDLSASVLLQAARL